MAPTLAAKPLIAVGVGVAAALIAAPFAGLPVVRLPAILVPALLIVAFVLRPWRWDDRQLRALDAWVPSTRLVWSVAVVVLAPAIGLPLLAR